MGVCDALRRVAGAPKNDRFLVITEHGPQTLVMDRTYLVAPTKQALVIQITLNAGRRSRRPLFRAIAGGPARAGRDAARRRLVNPVEVAKENWSFGGGDAQYCD